MVGLRVKFNFFLICQRMETLISKFEGGDDGKSGLNGSKMNERIESMERNIQHILRVLDKR